MHEGDIPNRRGRPRGLIALALLLAVFQAGAAVRTLAVPPDLAARISLPLPLEFAASAVWAVLAALVAVALLLRRRRSILLFAGLAVGFLAYSLARLAVFARADYDRQHLPFLAITAAVVVLLAAAYLVRFRSTEALDHGRRPKN